VRGREAIREFYKGYYSGSWKLLDEQFKNTSLVLQEDLAIETADYSGEIEHGQMGTVHFKGKNFVIWRRQKDGSWKLFRDMWSSSTAQ
jgi:ketosteroid isomerase-like protein